MLRPWGPVDWTLSLSNEKRWSFVGCIGTEERSLGCWSHLCKKGLLGDVKLALIRDFYSVQHQEMVTTALKDRNDLYTSLGGDVNDIKEFDLMEELSSIQSFSKSIVCGQNSSVLLDITSFPKRFWFIILRELLKSEKVSNLVITYTSPESYAPDDEPLYEEIVGDLEEYIPGFGGTGDSSRVWVASVGFLVEGLKKYARSNRDEKIKLLIPFPASLGNLRRTWLCVADLKDGQNHDRFDDYRIDPRNISAAFDCILSFDSNSSGALAFAPFGPKPISAAMCLFASQKENSSVHYPQPKVYHPEYSKGILDDDPAKAVCAYWIKHEKKNLYALK